MRPVEESSCPERLLKITTLDRAVAVLPGRSCNPLTATSQCEVCLALPLESRTVGSIWVAMALPEPIGPT
jgi:hypothetical protein